jgi:hexosaminidase
MLLVTVFSFFLSGCGCTKQDPKAQVPSVNVVDSSSDPKIWPKPVELIQDTGSLCSLPKAFHFELGEAVATSHRKRLEDATRMVNSMVQNLFQKYDHPSANHCETDVCRLDADNYHGQLSESTESESYTISFRNAEGCKIRCKTAYGCIRGLFTFLQLIDPVKKFRLSTALDIKDQPAFSHRGLLIDTSRHYIPVSMIEDHLRVMALVKMNVLHWHIVDDHSFPLKLEGESVKRLSEAAYNPSAVYTKEDIRKIVDLASSLGIRVIPEIDIPGHTVAWRKSYPELLGIAKAALDPTREENYVFIEAVLREVIDMFSSDVYEGTFMMHLGGDETWDGWETDAIKKWMSENNIGSPEKLIAYWMKRVSGIAKKLGIRIIQWDDFLRSTNGDISGFGDEDNHITWQTWLRDVAETTALATSINRNVVFSSAFYLDHLQKTWPDFYNVDLRPTQGVLGGEACMWTEWVDKSNMFPRVWPRAAAVAERLWCGPRCATDHQIDAVLRIAKWRCRAVYLYGFEAIEPVGCEKANTPDDEHVNHTDREQWWCKEQDLVPNSYSDSGTPGTNIQHD